MRIGLIARADSRGLGIQCKAFFDHMHPTKTLVVDCPSAKPLPIRRDWYPGATWITGLPKSWDFTDWLKGLDVVYTAETGYNPGLWSEARRLGVKTVLHANYEFLNRADAPTVWAAPSTWHINDFPPGAAYLPVPIETHRFTPNEASRASHFLHIVGRPAVHDRNGTQDLLKALQYVTSEITVTIKCQEAGYARGMVGVVPSNVRLLVEDGDVANYWDLYQGQDVLVLPRRFGGLCLPANEAVGAGMPVVMPDISPNEWLPAEWLVPAVKTHSDVRVGKQRIDLHETDCKALASKIDLMASDDGFYVKATVKAQALAESMSWTTLKPLYEQVFTGRTAQCSPARTSPGEPAAGPLR